MKWQHKKHAIDASRQRKRRVNHGTKNNVPRHASKPQKGLPREWNRRLLSYHASCQRALCRSGGILGRPTSIVPTASDQPTNRLIRMRRGRWARRHVRVNARVRSGHPTGALGQGMYTVPKPCRDIGPSSQRVICRY